jgi:AraC family transcriptional regulator
MNNAVEYIEYNMLEEIDTGALANEAKTTSSHFQKMFHMLTGTTVGEYIRRRRLSIAAQEIASGESSIIDIAFKYGYKSHASFTKAFTRLHGFSPVIARVAGMKIKAYPPISFQVLIKGDTSLDYKIKECKQIRLVGKSIKVNLADGENIKICQEFWNKCTTEGSFQKILQLADFSGQLCGAPVSVNTDFAENFQDCIYMIGAESRIEILPEGMEERIIDPQTYAIFEPAELSTEGMQKLWRRIFSEWFPATNYIHAPGAELEIYRSTEARDWEVWIPVVAGK